VQNQENELAGGGRVTRISNGSQGKKNEKITALNTVSNFSRKGPWDGKKFPRGGSFR